MKRSRIIFLVWCLLLVPAACTAGPGTQPVYTGKPMATETGPVKTATVRPTVTLSATPSEIPTVEPMVTPSPGPAPDVEIFNVTFASSMSSTAFLGEIRNNSNQPLVFPGRLMAFQLGLEHWWTNSNIYYYHRIFNAFIKPQIDDNQLNCIIYPGETGVIAVDFNICSAKENCSGEGEELSTPPPQLGYRLLNYNSYPKRWDNFLQLPYIKIHYPAVLDKGYHLKIDNFTYESQVIEEQMDWGVMFFEFDVTFYMPAYQRDAQTPIWIILYDKEGRIVNVMRNSWVDLCEGRGCAKSGKPYHISGVACNRTYCLWEDWQEVDPRIQWFEPIAKLTIEGMNRVDHIRVLAENQDVDICINPEF